MCLDVVFDEKRKKSEIEKLEQDEKGYITVWKAVAWKNIDGIKNIYYTPVTEKKLYKGKNVFKKNVIRSVVEDEHTYKGGTHLFVSKKNAENWPSLKETEIIKCKVKKEWINTVGTQIMGFRGSALVLVSSKAILPKYISKFKIKKYIRNVCYNIYNIYNNTYNN